jgi:hypothetical protein
MDTRLEGLLVGVIDDPGNRARRRVLADFFREAGKIELAEALVRPGYWTYYREEPPLSLFRGLWWQPSVRPTEAVCVTDGEVPTRPPTCDRCDRLATVSWYHAMRLAPGVRPRLRRWLCITACVAEIAAGGPLDLPSREHRARRHR